MCQVLTLGITCSFLACLAPGPSPTAVSWVAKSRATCLIWPWVPAAAIGVYMALKCGGIESGSFAYKHRHNSGYPTHWTITRSLYTHTHKNHLENISYVDLKQLNALYSTSCNNMLYALGNFINKKHPFPITYSMKTCYNKLQYIMESLQYKLKSYIISIVKPTRCTSVSNLFYFGMTHHMFRTVFPSIIRSSRLYKQQQAFVKQILLLFCTVLNSWWWTERLSETCGVSFQNKINLIHWCI